MALNSLNLKVSKQDFETRIAIVETKMALLVDVIDRYSRAKENLDQFIESSDSNYQSMVERIDANVASAKKAHAALNETKNSLQSTADKMENMGREIKETIESATEAASGVIQAVLKVESIL